ncbi:MAG: hypothetical protein ACI4WT_09050 [Oligosphaeraceae bacterium]
MSHSCPQCGHPLDVQDPNVDATVTCTHCHQEVTVQTTTQTADNSTPANAVADTHGFDLEHIGSLNRALIASLVANGLIALLSYCVTHNQNPGEAPSPYAIHVLTGLYALNTIFAVIVWAKQWKAIGKSTASLLVHIAFPILTLLLDASQRHMGFWFSYIAISQAAIVLKHRGDVTVTFFNVKPNTPKK